MADKQLRLTLPALFGLAFLAAITAGPKSAAAGQITWRDWDPALFDQAKAEHRYVLLDLEAVWCHWCHVMADTTYADPAVIADINAHYIAVRVDQDAHPDISLRYEDWGWPATIVFAPDKTEIVKLRGYRNPLQFEKILQAILADPSPVDYGAVPAESPLSPAASLPAPLAHSIEAAYAKFYDPTNGGWGTFNKFIDDDAMGYALALSLAGDKQAGVMARQTLDAALNLIDPVWGGAYQYSDKVNWKSPHFEKIMSIQASYLRLYSLASERWPDAGYGKAADALYGYLTNFLLAQEGAFYTSQDADLSAAVTGHDYYPLSDGARRKLGLPALDRNIYARENGWAISALAAYYDASGNERALAAAVRAARWIEANRRREDGGFDHGGDGRGPFLGDDLAMAQAYLDLYRSTADRAWLASSRRTMDDLLKRFGDPATGGFFAEAPQADALLGKPVKSMEENVGVVRLANLLFRYTGDETYRKAAETGLGYLASSAVTQRYAFLPGVLLAARELASEPAHVTVIGSRGDGAAAALFAAARRYPAAYLRAEWWDPAEGPLPNPDVAYPQLSQSAGFACANGICSLPAFDAGGLTTAMDRLNRAPAQN